MSSVCGVAVNFHTRTSDGCGIRQRGTVAEPGLNSGYKITHGAAASLRRFGTTLQFEET